MFKSKNQYLVPLLLSGFLAVGLWIGHSFSPTESAFSGTSGQEKYQKMQDIINVLNEKYVDTLNGDALFEQTISDMLHKLDPHSNYISAKDLQSVNESIQGQFGGVGVRFMILRDTICVTNGRWNKSRRKKDLQRKSNVLIKGYREHNGECATSSQ